MEAEHENDATKQGPETVKLSGVGNCDPMWGACGATLYVEDFTGSGLPDSGVYVALYHGEEKVQTFTFPEGADPKLWPVFTIDSQEGAETVIYDGKKTLCPFILDDGGEADWAASLDNEGWSVLPEKALATGFYRAPGNENLHNLDQASYATMADTAGLDCLDANWAIAFNSANAVACDDGYFVAGLYRVGGKNIKGEGVHQVDMARCCKPKETPKVWVKCQDVSFAFTEPGWAKCPAGTLLAGVERSAEPGLSGLTKAKCCAYETKQGC